MRENFSDGDWKALTDALDSKEIRELAVAEDLPPMGSRMLARLPSASDATQNSRIWNSWTIKVANPYEKQLMPLLELVEDMSRHPCKPVECAYRFPVRTR